MAASPRILVVDADPALRGLLEEWLEPQGFRGVRSGDADLVVVDIASPRQDCGVLQRIAQQHPRAPRLVLSSSIFPGVECCGPVARDLGVAGVLPKPVSRDALL